MIVFDGDSMMCQKGYGITPEHHWAHLVADGRTYENIGVHMSTAEDCAKRLDVALDHYPQWYVLQIGQWSQNHEPLSTFEHQVRRICEYMNLERVRTVLVSPAPQILDGFDIEPFVVILKKLALIYRAGFVNLYDAMKDSQIDNLVCNDHSKCHFNEEGHRLAAYEFNRRIAL